MDARTDRWMHRQREKQPEGAQVYRPTYILIGTHMDAQADRCTDVQMDKEMGTQSGRYTDGYMHLWAGRQTSK